MPFQIEPQSFVSTVRPLLESNDAHGLLETLRLRWDCGQIARLLNHSDAATDGDARKVALLCLGMVGDRTSVEAVGAQLRDADGTINHLAEHALWSIWFRLGSSGANDQLGRGVRLISYRKLDAAIECFDRAVASDPDFAEAYNQRAIARFLQDDFEGSIADCRKTVRLMPVHFGAWAGMGHCFLHLCQLNHALKSYERALVINPHMSCVRQTVAEIRTRI